jgi:hypothetical protein
VWCGGAVGELPQRTTADGCRVGYDDLIQLHGLHATDSYPLQKIAREVWELAGYEHEAECARAIAAAWRRMKLPFREGGLELDDDLLRALHAEYMADESVTIGQLAKRLWEDLGAASPASVQERIRTNWARLGLKRRSSAITRTVTKATLITDDDVRLIVGLSIAHAVPVSWFCAMAWERFRFQSERSMVAYIGARRGALMLPQGRTGRRSHAEIERARHAQSSGALAEFERRVAALVEDPPGVPQLQLSESDPDRGADTASAAA